MLSYDFQQKAIGHTDLSSVGLFVAGGGATPSLMAHYSKHHSYAHAP